MKTTNHMQRRPAMERLETREVMTGNIQAVFSGGDLQISGDDRGNGVRIVELSPGSGNYRLEGLDQAGGATKINGQSSVEFRHVYGNLSFDMHGGDDRVKLGGTCEWMTNSMATNIDMGYGDDTVDIYYSQLGKLTISTGLGDDAVKLNRGTIRYGADISLGAGDDRLELQDSTVGYGLDIDAHNGADQILLNSVKVGYDLDVGGGDGDDRVELSGVTCGQDVHINTYDGDDTVVLNNVAADRLYANLGAARDSLSVTGCRARHAHFWGETGHDTIQHGANNQIGSELLDSFEV